MQPPTTERDTSSLIQKTTAFVNLITIKSLCKECRSRGNKKDRLAYNHSMLRAPNLLSSLSTQNS